MQIMTEIEMCELRLLAKLEMLKAERDYAIERLRKLLDLAPPPNVDPAQVSNKETNLIKVRRRAYVSAGRWLRRIDEQEVEHGCEGIPGRTCPQVA